MALLNRSSLRAAALAAALALFAPAQAACEETLTAIGASPEAAAAQGVDAETGDGAAAAPGAETGTGETEPRASRLVFIATDPLGATVYLDGVRLDKAAPLLLRDRIEAPTVVRVEKEGFHPVELALPAGGDVVVELVLVPRRVTVGLGELSDDEGARLLLPAGTYRIATGPAGFEVVAVYPRQRLLDGVRFALPAVGIIGGALAVREILAPRDGEYVVSAELVAALGLGAGLLAWDLVLEFDRRDFMDRFRLEAAPGASGTKDSHAELEAADRALGRGEFGEALSRYEAYAVAFPDQPLSIRARVEAADIRYLLGAFDAAEALYRETMRDYPWPGLYDRAVKGVSDCRLALGDPAGALAALDLMTYVGGSLEREDVALHRRWLEELAERDPVETESPEEAVPAPSGP